MSERFGPIDGRELLREVERFGGAYEVMLGGVGREHRADLVLLAVEPSDEEHLNGAAAIPVALFVVRADTAYASAKALRDHRSKRWVALCRDAHLPFGGGGAADGSDFAAGPRLRGHPGEFVVTIGQRRPKDVVLTFREEVPAFVHLNKDIAALDSFELRGHVARRTELHVPVVEVVGSANKDDGVFLRRIFGPIDVGCHALAVAHGDHQLTVDYGNGLELLLDCVTLGDQLRIGRGRRLSESFGAGKASETGDDGEQEVLLWSSHGRRL